MNNVSILRRADGAGCRNASLRRALATLHVLPFACVRMNQLRALQSVSRALAMHRFAALILALAAGIATQTAAATDFCVHSVAEIQAALTTAATNGANDVIMIAGGSYTVSTMLVFASNEPQSIKIQGGFSPLCDQFIHAETTLDGQQLVRPLYVGNGNGDIQIAFLTFVAGFAEVESNGGGLIAESNAGSIDIVLNRFIGNLATA